MVHWDHPQVIEDLGGWTNEMIVDWFEDYARVLFRELGPKVRKWITLNEPEAACLRGYSSEVHAPGKKIHGVAEYLCAHNALKAHARAYRIYQKEFKAAQNGSVGIVVNMKYFYPKNSSTDQSAAEKAFHFSNGWMIHPIFTRKGDYPDIMKDIIANNSRAQGYPKSRLPQFSEEWIEYIRYHKNTEPREIDTVEFSRKYKGLLIFQFQSFQGLRGFSGSESLHVVSRRGR